jgi:Ran GTPase-activating protein (RanGAP) involved in mRNA processing and transport
LIYNCGLGTLGAIQISKGLKGTPNLKTFSIGRNRMENAGIQAIS